MARLQTFEVNSLFVLTNGEGNAQKHFDWFDDIYFFGIWSGNVDLVWFSNSYLYSHQIRIGNNYSVILFRRRNMFCSEQRDEKRKQKIYNRREYVLQSAISPAFTGTKKQPMPIVNNVLNLTRSNNNSCERNGKKNPNSEIQCSLSFTKHNHDIADVQHKNGHYEKH